VRRKIYSKRNEKQSKKKVKKNLTISKDNVKANALLKDYSLKYKKIAKTSIMLAIADGDNKGESIGKMF
jgi:hypothetical protein